MGGSLENISGVKFQQPFQYSNIVAEMAENVSTVSKVYKNHLQTLANNIRTDPQTLQIEMDALRDNHSSFSQVPTSKCAFITTVVIAYTCISVIVTPALIYLDYMSISFK